MVMFANDHSTWCKIYFLTTKGEVFDKFREYKNMIETFTGRKI